MPTVIAAMPDDVAAAAAHEPTALLSVSDGRSTWPASDE